MDSGLDAAHRPGMTDGKSLPSFFLTAGFDRRGWFRDRYSTQRLPKLVGNGA
jgi:hypothetical protein